MSDEYKLNTLRTIPLLNGMVDAALVFGFDETCSRELEVEGEVVDTNFDAISQRELKLHFLQIITPGQVYPERSADSTNGDSSACDFSSPVRDDAFGSPLPSKHKKKFQVEDFGLSWETIETMHFFIFPEGKNKGTLNSPISTPQTPSSSSSFFSGTTTLSEGPRMYNNIDDLPPSIIPILLTNITGERTFASFLRFTRPFFISRPNSSCCYYSLTPWSPVAVPSSVSRQKLVYLPTCLVLISKRPSFQFMKDALSGFHSNLVNEAEDKEFWEVVREFCERIFMIPAPPPGSLSLECELPGFQSNTVIRPPRGGLGLCGTSAAGLSHCPPHPDQYLDIRFNYPFMCLSVDNVLQVMSALLTGKNVLFISSLYPMLTYVIQSFLSYISPFVWRHAVVPILPYSLLEILDAPVATIIGIHTSLMFEPEFERIENAIIVELDNDKVTVKLQDDSERLPPLPRAAVEIFKTKYSMLQRNIYEIEAMQKLSPMSSSSKQKEREEFERGVDDVLAKLFLELMVRLFHKVIKQLIQSRIKYEEAIKEMEPNEQEFYRQTECTDTFTAFYQSQKQRTQSDFNLLAIRLEREERRYGHTNEIEESYLHRFSHRSTAVVNWMGNSLRKSSVQASISFSSSFIGSLDEAGFHRVSPVNMMSCGAVNAPESTRMELPALGANFKGREAFLDNVIETLDELQRNKAVEAQCVSLRGYYLLCKREFVRALDDFYDTLQRLEVNLVPHHKSLQVLSNFLSVKEKADMQDNSHFKFLSINRRKTLNPPDVSRHFGKTLPKKPINLTDFQKIVNQNAIASDAESASNLHTVLSQERTTVIYPETFKTFYEAWKLVQEENDRVDLPNVTLGKAEKGHRVAERVLAVANFVRTNFGSQSTLVLTTYRLLAVTGFTTHVMAEFSVPMRFENFSYSTTFIGAKNPGIRIELLGKQRTERKKPQDFYMAFQHYLDRENWYHMLVEMLSGWQLAQRKKDPCVMETAQDHVILLNAINQSGLIDQCNYAQRTKKVLKLLSFQSKDASEVSPITVEALQYRINPCLHETDKQTVESLLYIPSSMDDEDCQGKLWIGLGNGRLKVYDIESRCFESDIKITESKYGRSVRLSCLLLVNQHVWVGSFSKNIHILDVETVCHVSQLSFLEDVPRDMALSQDGQVVWSLLLNGVLLAWDTVTRKRVSKMQVPISDVSQYTTCTCFTLWQDEIWVGTNRGSISVMDRESGTRLKEIFFPCGTKRQVDIKHLAISNEDEVWCSVYSIPKSEDSIFIAVFNPRTHEKVMHYSKLDSRVSIILPVHNSMWCGTKSGKIYIFHAKNYAKGKGMPKTLSAHDDFIRTMALTDIDLVVSGSGSNDGYAAVWKTIELED